jgi:hypothetical protein
MISYEPARTILDFALDQSLAMAAACTDDRQVLDQTAICRRREVKAA